MVSVTGAIDTALGGKDHFDKNLSGQSLGATALDLAYEGAGREAWCVFAQSLLPISANTSRTFWHYSHLMLITFSLNLIIGSVFASMVLSIWISILLQVFEILQIVQPYSVLSVVRSPRPLILVRFIRVFFKFSMPKSRIKQIFKRSSQQIYNVSIQAAYFGHIYFGPHHSLLSLKLIKSWTLIQLSIININNIKLSIHYQFKNSWLLY